MAMRSIDVLLRSVSIEAEGTSEMSIHVLELEPGGDHQDLCLVEQLGDLLSGALRPLVLGGHPGLGRLFDDLLPDEVHAPVQRRDGGGTRGPLRRLRLQLGEQLFERLHGRRLWQLINRSRRTTPSVGTWLRLAGMVSRNTLAALSSAAVLVTALTGCAPADEKNSSSGVSATASGSACAPGALDTQTAGKLTIGTDNPAYEPWFSDNKPANGKGFESAVAYQVAERLGYPAANVVWTSVTFNNAIAPGPKTFDFDINQFSITPERRKAVDFSSPYYLVRQTVITTEGSKIAGAKSIVDLKGAKLGSQVGTTSYQAINELIKPDAKAQVFNNNDDAKAALENRQIDGIVVDLPTAFYMTSAELDK